MSDTSDIIGDIEDLITLQDVLPKTRNNVKKYVAINTDHKRTNELSSELQIYSSVIPGNQSIYIKTWGCTHNSSDSEYMAGQLVEYGYNLTEDKYVADLWILNSCTVKNPAEDHFRNEIRAGKKFGKHIIVSGCVPQGAPKSNYLKGLSIIGVQQIDKVVEVVEETLRGNTVKYLNKKKENGKNRGVSLFLPKVRKNPLIEIIPINTGCLNQCTYCKTKHARGELRSYKIEEIIDRARQAFEEGVKELWLTSEDTGTYGRDINNNLPELLWKLLEIVPDGCRIRIGMTNPPYILEHLDEMSKILQHQKVYSFLHMPVQSGSDRVLFDMKREYCVSDFEHIINFLKTRIPRLTVATDIICGFPTETDQDFQETLNLCKKYKFPSLFINQFFSRPGTPAALMNQIPPKEIKKRTKALSEFFQSYEPYSNEIGEIQEVLVTEVAHDKKHYVAHNRYYEQILIPMEQEYMGKMIQVKIISASKHSMKGEPLNDTFLLTFKQPLMFKQICRIFKNSNPCKIHIFTIVLIFFTIIVRLIWKFFSL